MSYKAIVAVIDSVEAIDGADRIQKASVLGNQVIVPKEYCVGMRGVFFDVDGQLSEEFAEQNNLVRKKDLNGLNTGGFLEENRRIKCLKLKGVKSSGLFLDLECVNYIKGIEKILLEPGYQFDRLFEQEICNKYVTPATLSAQRALLTGKKVKRGETEMFKKHFDTEQLMRCLSELKEGDRLIITHKLHGTSHRCGYVLDVKPQTWLQRLFGKKLEFEWQFMSGTRNVITSDDNKDTAFHSPAMRTKADALFEGKLHKGEVIYCEIVGFEAGGTPIMNPVSINKLEKMEQMAYQNNLGAKDGTIIYTYGNQPGEQEVYVYRIALRNEDGHSVDYSWEDVKRRCLELGVKHVPEVKIVPSFNGNHRAFADFVQQWYESQPDFIDESHPLEGVVVRVESGLNPRAYKYKTYIFRFLEGIAKDNAETVDTEESA